MLLYEYIYILRSDLSVNQVENIHKRVTSIIESYQGKIHNMQSWGLRNLAYKIKKNKKAQYFIFNIEASFDAIKELQRVISNNENVLRQMVLKVEKFDENNMLIESKREEYKKKERKPVENEVNNSEENSSISVS